MSLTIRKMRETDTEDLYRLLSDPVVMEHLEMPFSREKTERFLADAGLSDPPLIYAAEDDGSFIGYVIYHGFGEDSVEVGWVLKPELWGKGYATSLTDMMIKKALASGKQVVIECSSGQEASRRIARKFNFRYDGTSGGLEVFRLDQAGSLRS